MKRILFLLLLAFVLLVSSAFADTCYRVVEFYSPECWGVYHLLAYSDQTFITEKGEWGVWGSEPTGTMIYFQFWHEKWNYPYLFLSGTKKAGFCQSDTGIIGDTGRIGYYTLKKIKSVNCNFGGKAGVVAEMVGPMKE